MRFSGNVWVCGPGGVWVYAPHGVLIGKLRVPELVGNLTWGGEGFRTLFLTATHSLYAVETKIGPRSEPYMRDAARAAAGRPVVAAAPAATVARNGTKKAASDFVLDPSRCALIIQDMQNDVVMDGGRSPPPARRPIAASKARSPTVPASQPRREREACPSSMSGLWLSPAAPA